MSNPTANKYYLIQHYLNFISTDPDKIQVLDEFNKLIQTASQTWMDENKITLPDNVPVADLLNRKNEELIDYHIKKFAKYFEQIESINANYFINLTYTFNITLIERLLLVSKITESKDSISTNEKCVEFIQKYRLDDESQRNTPIHVNIPDQTINEIRQLAYNIYRCLFNKRKSHEVFVDFKFHNKVIYIAFADDIRYFNAIPKFLNKDRRLDFCTLRIPLDEYNINYAIDERLIRNRIRRYNNYKRLESLKDYLELQQAEAKRFSEGIELIKKNKSNTELRYQAIFDLITTCEVVCPDQTLVTVASVRSKIAELEKIDTYLSDESWINIL